MSISSHMLHVILEHLCSSYCYPHFADAGIEPHRERVSAFTVYDLCWLYLVLNSDPHDLSTHHFSIMPLLFQNEQSLGIIILSFSYECSHWFICEKYCFSKRLKSSTNRGERTLCAVVSCRLCTLYCYLFSGAYALGTRFNLENIFK